MATSVDRGPSFRKAHCPDSSRPWAVTAIVSVVTGIALVGILLAARQVLSEPVVALNTEARSGDLSVWVDRYQWLGHDMGQTEGEDLGETSEAEQAINDVTAQAQVFPMPSSMMPGMPEDGYQRLQADITVVNRGVDLVEVSPADFVLESSDGDRWPAMSGGTFNLTDIGAGYGLGTVVAFDVLDEKAAVNMYLLWVRDDGVIRFALGASGHGGHG